MIADCSLVDVWQIASEQKVLCFIFSLNCFHLKFRIVFCVKSQIFEAVSLGVLGERRLQK